MEQSIVEHESALPFRAIRAAAVRGRSPAALVRSMKVIQGGIRDARRLLREERPAAILGTGGYVCVPLFLAARLAKIPTMVYLPDIVPGLAVRLLSRIATRVACSFEPSLEFLPRAKTVVTGYPVRPGLGELDKEACRAHFGLQGTLPVLLVYGGSRGARSINRAIAQLLPDLLARCAILHVCGREGDEQFLREAALKLPEDLQAHYHIYPYLQGTMGEALRAADLAVCRAGASTMAELPVVGLPAVLVPLLGVHQDANALYLSERGAAVTVPDDKMLGTTAPTDGPLFTAIAHLLADDAARQTMVERSRTLARPDAVECLADLFLDLVG